jgi:hypothetical protein
MFSLHHGKDGWNIRSARMRNEMHRPISLFVRKPEGKKHLERY